MNKQLHFSPLDDNQLDAHIKNTLNGSFPLPEPVKNAREEACAKIRAAAKRSEEEKQYPAESPAVYESQKKEHKKIRKALFRGFAAAGAAAAAFSCVCIADPSAAAQIPIVSHIFESLGKSLKFSGDYKDLAESVKKSESITAGQPADTVKTTLTVSEAYCNESALYLGLVLHSSEKLPETFLDQEGKPVVEIKGSVDFDFDKEASIDWASGGSAYIDGKMADEHTYTGIIRFDMGQYFADKDTEIPKKFQIKLSVSQIAGTKPEDSTPEMPENLLKQYEAGMQEHGLGLEESDYAQFTEEQKQIEHQLFTDMWNAYYALYPESLQHPNKYQNWIIDGSWDFTFSLAGSTTDVIHLDLSSLDENGLGIVSVTKTPAEITIETTQTTDHFTVVLDADGNLMDESSGSSNGHTITVSAGGRDTSRIDVYICDYIEYMDELKGYWWSEDYAEKAREKTFRQLLNERSLYHKEINFQQQF